MSTLSLSQYQDTPTHYAAMVGSVEALELLQEHRALFNLVDNNDDCCLSILFISQHK